MMRSPFFFRKVAAAQLNRARDFRRHRQPDFAVEQMLTLSEIIFSGFGNTDGGKTCLIGQRGELFSVDILASPCGWRQQRQQKK